ncbi:aquaporin Z [Microbacterium keratanolyticum]|uniref:Aquaporin n=1 Tax=Microbacterium keratanolyticum TaxID=67574 RepID=A0A9W6HU05_9MICO|nr:aquaporin Z [Microbacterium keratanolyticum]MBM7467915.1 aquaporin Z [Microbacterium keratanolyticum]GLK02906.1 aquaporin [Microbacterium keratanolyticum]
MSDSPSAVPTLGAKIAAEAFGTFLLVFGGVGTALFASNHFTDPGANSAVYVAVALAFGLTVVVGAYAFGPISGGHFNPAVTLGAAAAGRISWRDVGPYIIAQVIGGVVASTALVLIGTFGPDGWLSGAQDAGFASNGWGEHSPGGFGMFAAITVEIILTAFFLFVILGTTHAKRGTPFAGLAIGLTLTLIHLISIPVDNTSVNPARSIAAAIYGGVGPLSQLWVFLVFPVVGAMIAGFAYKALFDATAKQPKQL